MKKEFYNIAKLVTQNSKVLDVGCGNGWTLRKFIDMGGQKGYGCDLSNKMIEKARTFTNYNIQYSVGDVENFVERASRWCKVSASEDA